MSGIITAIVGSAVIAGSASIYGAKKQAAATRQAAKLQKQASDDALRQQQQEQNQLNQREVDQESLLEANTGSDTQATILTNPGGLTIDDLILGRGTSLLGGRK